MQNMTQTDFDHLEIIRRVLDAVPARSYAMNALLSLMRIEVTRTVPTAAVSCERRPVLLINPDFVARHCRSNEHLFLLVMHELYHVLLGHTRLFPRPTPVHNLAFDAVINATLVSRFPQQVYTSFFTDLYGGRQDALRLLAPPGHPPIHDPTLRALHDTLYNDGDVTSQQIFELIASRVDVGALDVADLLGRHGDDRDAWGTDSESSADLIEVVRAIVEKWPPPEKSCRGRSVGERLVSERVSPRSPQERVTMAVRAALHAAASRPGITFTTVETHHSVESPVPELRDRRAMVLRSLGRRPLLNAADIPSRRRSDGRAIVYLDVSGSLDAVLPLLYGALRSLRAHIAPDVHLFSSMLVTIGLDLACRGHVETTGGTDITCVLKHVTATRPKKVLVITDGYVGAAEPPVLAAAVRACRDIRFLLTPGGWRRDVERFASRVDELPSLEGSL
jgi:hypothetical protein